MFRHFMREHLAIFGCLLPLMGCSSEPVKIEGANLVCAFVEGYVETKVLIMSSPPSEAVSYAETLVPTPESLSSVSPFTVEAKNILLDYREAIIRWSSELSAYTQDENKARFAEASKALESSIDNLAEKCEKLGWEFKDDWR